MDQSRHTLECQRTVLDQALSLVNDLASVALGKEGFSSFVPDLSQLDRALANDLLLLTEEVPLGVDFLVIHYVVDVAMRRACKHTDETRIISHCF